MPWKETHPLDQRRQFVALARADRMPFVELCRMFGVSTKSGYKWLRRFAEDGDAGLADRSRRPRSNSRAVEDEVVWRILALRKKYPRWGPRKLLAWLQERQPNVSWPAPSTVGALLVRRGLVEPRRKRSPTPSHVGPLAHCQAPNDVWSADFKGWFRVGTGERCDPLTISDGFSRYLLCVRHVQGERWEPTWRMFERTFREYGLPKALRTDNGHPFASNSPAGLSRLSVRFVKLGIDLERIQKGHPEQNGRHERMHQTLKAEVAQPPRDTLRAQQLALNRFRDEYNRDRPHEALGQKPPATVYTYSLRLMPAKLPEVEYPEHFELRKVSHTGTFKWRDRTIWLSEVLQGETIGLTEVDNGRWDVHFGPLRLGSLHDAHPDDGLLRTGR
jgi:transposase InsO family protein